MKIPAQYLPVMPYIIVKNAVGFKDFVKSTFDATEQLIVPGKDGRSIMHGELKIHDAVIMFAQSTNDWKDKTCGMFIYVEDVDGVYKKALLNGAKNLMPPVKQDYGYTAGFEDVFGNQWWVVQGE